VRNLLIICVTSNADSYDCRILTSAHPDGPTRTQRVITASNTAGNATATIVITHRADRAVQHEAENVHLSAVVQAGANVPPNQIWYFNPFAQRTATLRSGRIYTIQKKPLNVPPSATAVPDIYLTLNGDKRRTSRL
jgi:hypothetical protein